MDDQMSHLAVKKKVIKWKFKTIEQDVMVKILQMTQLFDTPAGADNACN